MENNYNNNNYESYGEEVNKMFYALKTNVCHKTIDGVLYLNFEDLAKALEADDIIEPRLEIIDGVSYVSTEEFVRLILADKVSNENGKALKEIFSKQLADRGIFWSIA
jgi:hypothetical protein